MHESIAPSRKALSGYERGFAATAPLPASDFPEEVRGAAGAWQSTSIIAKALRERPPREVVEEMPCGARSFDKGRAEGA